MKKIVLALFVLLISGSGFSQSGLVVQHNSKGLYVAHTVQPKENFYAIGRLYAISPKDIAAFNALDMNAGLEIGQTVLIPLTAANFSQTKTKGTPVYYVVGQKEGLYRVSQNNGNVLMANLRKWNHLNSDNISAGQKLIVGYLQGSGPGTATTVARTEVPAQKTPPQNTESQISEPKQELPKKEIGTQPEPQRDAPKKEVKTTPAPEVKLATTTAKPAATTGAGYFKTQYEQQSRDRGAGYDATVTSGIFKTTSGWQDSKYYALMDKVEPGTIVQVVNPGNNKSIYAKVLGQMSGIRQNQGLELRISNAAATALDIADPDKFIVRVQY